MDNNNFYFAGVSEAQLKACIMLVLMGKYNNPRAINSFLFTDEGLKLYWSEGEVKVRGVDRIENRMSTGFSWEGELVFTLTKHWLKSKRAKKILGDKPSESSGSFGEGFSITDGKGDYECVMIIKPRYEYYAK